MASRQPSARALPIRKKKFKGYEAESIMDDAERVQVYEAMRDLDGKPPTYVVEDYITLSVFRHLSSTVIENKTLWLETGAMAILYWITFGALFHFRGERFAHLAGKETDIRAFLAMFSTLIGLLLSFYTAMNLARWWEMRLSLMNIVEGCNRLTVLLAHGATSDAVLLANVKRYARASLFLLFANFRLGPDENTARNEALEKGFLTKEEADLLAELNPHSAFIQAETLWVWLTSAITKVNAQGLTQNGPKTPHYVVMLKAIELSRSGIADIQTYLETPIPFGYVHLLCSTVKLHNIILTLLMAVAGVKLAGDSHGVDGIGLFRTAFRAFLMPFLYNAILLLNSTVTNPFGDDFQDFNAVYTDTLIKSSGVLSKAASNTPLWISAAKKSRKYEGVAFNV